MNHNYLFNKSKIMLFDGVGGACSMDDTWNMFILMFAIQKDL